MRKFILKFQILISVALFSYYVFELFDYVFELPSYNAYGHIGQDLMYHKISNVKNSDIVYFGDSVIRSYVKEDSVHSSIVELINEKYSQNIIDLSTFGSSMIIFHEYIKYFIKNDIRPEAIIIPFNLGLFSPFVEKTDIIYRTSLKNELRGFPFPYNIFDYQNTNLDTLSLIKLPGETLENKKDFILNKNFSKLEKAYILRYFQRFTDDNIVFKNLIKMNTAIIKNKLNVVYYFTPINVDITNYSANQGLIKNLLENKKEIFNQIKYVGSKNIMDLSFSLNNSYFTSSVPDGHLNFKGRQFIADKIGPIIK
jgi:hypothetical protein